MKPSPVQLLQLTFDKVSVELDPNHAPQEPHGLNSPFSFDGVTFRTAVGLAELDGAPTEEHAFEVALELLVENKKSRDKKTHRFSPYLLHLKGRAIVRLMKAAFNETLPEDLAAVNGAALIWSSMREQVAAITSRMPAGQILLPAVHFQDLRSDLKTERKQEDGSVDTASANEAGSQPTQTD
jgi:preprotein translocase subunit SecB